MNYYKDFKIENLDGRLWRGSIRFIPAIGHAAIIELDGYDPSKIILELQSVMNSYGAIHINDVFFNQYNKKKYGPTNPNWIRVFPKRYRHIPGSKDKKVDAR